jgi:hypothetical protein
VTFDSILPTLDVRDQNDKMDVFIHDMRTHQTWGLDQAITSNLAAEGASQVSKAVNNGRLVAFVSSSNDLVSNDTNYFDDIFLYSGGDPPLGLSYTGPRYLPHSSVIDPAYPPEDETIQMGDHVFLRLPFKNKGVGTVEGNVAVTALPETADAPGVSIFDGTTWITGTTFVTQTVPANLQSGQVGYLELPIFVTDLDPSKRKALHGSVSFTIKTPTEATSLTLNLEDNYFIIPYLQSMKEGDCLHNPGNLDVQKYAQYAIAAKTPRTPPDNTHDGDTQTSALKNLVATIRSKGEFTYGNEWATRVPDLVLLQTRGNYIGECINFADLSVSLLRSVGFPTRFTRAVFNNGSYAGHGWAEVYDDTNEWRTVDATSMSALDPSIFNKYKYAVASAWAELFPLTNATTRISNRPPCLSPCYETTPPDCPNCWVDSLIPPRNPPYWGPDCNVDRTRYYNPLASTPAARLSDPGLSLELDAQTAVTRTVPLTASLTITNTSLSAMEMLTATVGITEFVDSAAPIFAVVPEFHVVHDLEAGETVSVTWTVTPLVSRSSLPLNVYLEGDGLFEMAEKALSVNEAGTLPDLQLLPGCSADTVTPGQSLTLTASVLDPNFSVFDSAAVTATLYHMPDHIPVSNVDLSYCASCETYTGTLQIPEDALTGTHQIDFRAVAPGYDEATGVSAVWVAPSLVMTATLDPLEAEDDRWVALRVELSDRSQPVTLASVWADITAPNGELTIPLELIDDSFYLAVFYPRDLEAELGGALQGGDYPIRITAEMNGATVSQSFTLTIDHYNVYLPLLKR